jgi:hypothetical protein
MRLSLFYVFKRLYFRLSEMEMEDGLRVEKKTYETRTAVAVKASFHLPVPRHRTDTLTLQWKLLVRKRDTELCSFVNRQLVLLFHSWKLCGTEIEMPMHSGLLKSPVSGRIMSAVLLSCEVLFSVHT